MVRLTTLHYVLRLCSPAGGRRSLIYSQIPMAIPGIVLREQPASQAGLERAAVGQNRGHGGKFLTRPQTQGLSLHTETIHE